LFVELSQDLSTTEDPVAVSFRALPAKKIDPLQSASVWLAAVFANLTIFPPLPVITVWVPFKSAPTHEDPDIDITSLILKSWLTVKVKVTTLSKIAALPIVNTETPGSWLVVSIVFVELVAVHGAIGDAKFGFFSSLIRVALTAN